MKENSFCLVFFEEEINEVFGKITIFFIFFEGKESELNANKV